MYFCANQDESKVYSYLQEKWARSMRVIKFMLDGGFELLVLSGKTADNKIGNDVYS